MMYSDVNAYVIHGNAVYYNELCGNCDCALGDICFNYSFATNINCKRQPDAVRETQTKVLIKKKGKIIIIVDNNSQ